VLARTTTQKKHYLQFNGTKASCYLKKIVQEHNFELACEKIIEDKKSGEKLHERIFSMPRPMAARLVINRKTQIMHML
jgi:hypothetical protein